MDYRFITSLSKGIRPYILAIFLVLVVYIFKVIYPRNVPHPFLLASLPILVVIILGNVRAAASALAVSLLLLVYAFLPPYNSFGSVMTYIPEVILFTVQGLLVIWLVQKLKKVASQLDALNSELEAKVAERTRELEKAAKTLKKQKASLLALNKSKDEFILIASHELRTPATIVKQYIGMILEGYTGNKLPKKEARMLRAAQKGNDKQLKIINDLLYVAEIDAKEIILRKEQVDLASLINEVISQYRTESKARLREISFSKPRKKIVTQADPHRLHLALKHLVDNAHNYSSLDKKIMIKLSQSVKGIHIQVKDEGIGIESKDIRRIFGKFTRLSNQLSIEAGGAGLGLYLSKKIIRQHGGNITITSDKEKGSVFTVTLPTDNTASREITA